MRERLRMGDNVSGKVHRGDSVRAGIGIDGHYEAVCYPPVVLSNARARAQVSQLTKRVRSLELLQAVDRDVRAGRMFVSTLKRLQRFAGEPIFELPKPIWRASIDNIVVNEGLDYALDVGWSAGTQITTWYIGLLAASPSPLATWTATELATNDFVDYTEAALQAFVDAGVSGQSLDNSASTADFSIDTNSSSIGGAYAISTSAKATPAGTVASAGAFSGGNKAADNGDTLSVTLTLSSSDV